MHKKYIGNPVVTGAKTSKMTMTTGVIMNSLSSLFDSYLPPESIEIVLEKQSSISVKGYYLI